MEIRLTSDEVRRAVKDHTEEFLQLTVERVELHTKGSGGATVYIADVVDIGGLLRGSDGEPIDTTIPDGPEMTE